MPPTLDNGYLAVYDSGGITVYGRNRAQLCRIAQPTGALINVAIEADGTIATAVQDGSEKGSVLLWDTHASNFG
jgi:hypothetical protein